MEERVCQISKQAGSQPQRLGDLFLKVFGSAIGVELELSSRKPHEPMELK